MLFPVRPQRFANWIGPESVRCNPFIATYSAMLQCPDTFSIMKPVSWVHIGAIFTWRCVSRVCCAATLRDKLITYNLEIGRIALFWVGARTSEFAWLLLLDSPEKFWRTVFLINKASLRNACSSPTAYSFWVVPKGCIVGPPCKSDYWCELG